HFLERQLLRSDTVTKGKHPAGRADLDRAGAIFVQPAHLAASLLGAVDHRGLLAVHRGRQSPAVAMPSGCTERPACGNDARPDDIAPFDRLLEADVFEIGRSDIAYSCETRLDRRLGIGDTNGRPETVSVAQPLITADLRKGGQVDVHVNKPRKQGPLAKVDMLDVRAPAHGARVGDLGDAPVSADKDRWMLDRLPTVD